MGKTEYILVLITFNVVVLCFIIGVILYIKQYKGKKKEFDYEIKAKMESHQQELLSTQLEMQLQTMQHIGREIHDNVGQKLTLASLYTQQLSYENKAPHVNDKIENISSIINESLQELRRLSKSLTDDTIAQKNLVKLLSDECQRVKDVQKCDINFTASSPTIHVDYQIKNILLRVAQEFLQNSIKHAKCTLITVNLLLEDNIITLNLKDDGIGFDTSLTTYSGIGLKNMAKRIALLHGTYDLRSSINNGTSLHLKIPLTHEA